MLTFGSLALLGLLAAAAPPPSIDAAPRGASEIRIDGKLDEPVWQTAPVGRDFIERVPVPMGEPAAPTEFRVLYDEGALYVAVTSFLIPERERAPRALELTLDSFRIYRDDAVTLKFDVRRDRRTTVGFGVNPAGATIDYIALDNGAVFRREYDMLWEVETSVLPDRWIAEFRIPVAALGLSSKEGERILGFNVTRDHNAHLATYDWSHLPPEFGAMAALYYGELRGLRGMGGGLPLTLIPYALGAIERLDTGRDWDLKAGGEVRLNVAENVWTELTILTDFAQVDLDDPVVNLDRFPLFFPERRPFFLSGLEVFDFGAAGVSQLFFSRRIGLDEQAEIVPIIGGLKAYGRTGKTEFGALEVITAAEGETEAANHLVARTRYNFTNTSHLGVMVTHRGFLEDPTRTRERLFFDPNLGLGLDGSVRLGDRLEAAGFFAATLDETEASTDDGYSGEGVLRFRGEQVQPAFSLLVVTDDFEPQLGFVRRTGIARSRVELPWIHRTSSFGLASITTTAYAELTTSADFEENLEKRFTAETWVDMRNGWHFELGGDALEDVVQESFSLFDEIAIDPGRYNGLRLRAGFDTPGGRNPLAGVYYSLGNHFFGGVIHTLTGNAEAGLGPHLRLAASASYARTLLPDEEPIDVLTASGAIVIAPTNRLSMELNAQVNNIEEDLIGLLRIRWRYLPGSDLFFVYREDLDFAGAVSSERSFTLKMSYRFETVL